MSTKRRKVSHVRARLESAVSGQVQSEPHHIAYYSVDASSYIVRPDIIVSPRDGRDVSIVIRIACEEGVPVTPRGGGTGLVGGALNCGIILDMRHIDAIEVSPEKGAAVVGAGVPRGRLDEVLRRHGMMFAPNLSVGPFCTVGGMLANNAAGSRSIKYGSTIHNTNSVTMIDGTGNTVTLPEDMDAGRMILEVAAAAEIGRFPATSKNSSGYRLDAVRTMRDTHKAVVGSEGTLGAIVSAELRIVKKPESQTLFILPYGSVEDAAADCTRITGRTGPSALEFVDRSVLDNMEQRFGPGTECLLFIEYDDNDTDTDTGPGQSTWEDVSPATPNRSAGAIQTTDRSDIARWWRYRDAALHYSITAAKADAGAEGRVPHVIEDAVVPTASVREIFSALRSINSRYGTRTITYGHIGDGNIHVRIIAQKDDVKSLQSIAAEYFRSVISVGGSITGEHGDGLARSEFVEMQYGKRNMVQFSKLKDMFDPRRVMNPGKIVGVEAGTMLRNTWGLTRQDA